MGYCKHCEEYIPSYERTHNCRKVGLLDIDEDNSFIVSTLIGAATGSSLIGGILGGSFLGGLTGDLLEGDEDSFF